MLRWFIAALMVLLAGKDVLVAIHPALEWLPVALAGALLVVGLTRLLLASSLLVHWLLLSYIAFLVLRTFATGATTPIGFSFMLGVGLFVMVFFLLFWIVAFHLPSPPSLRWLFEFNVPLSLIISVLGVYQFFWDHTLFGTVTTIYGEPDSHVTRRAVSVFGTPQALAIYLSLSISYLLMVPKTRPRIAVLAVCIFTVALTGGKGVSVFFGAYLLAALLSGGARARYVLLGVAALWITYLTLGHTVLVGRIFGPVFMLIQGEGDARVDIWARYFDPNMSPLTALFGHGIGSAERIIYNRFGYGMDSAESYLLKLYYEIGVVGLAWFLAVYAKAMIRAWQVDSRFVPMLAGMLSNLVVVHAFAGMFIAFFFTAILVWFANDGSVDADPAAPAEALAT